MAAPVYIPNTEEAETGGCLGLPEALWGSLKLHGNSLGSLRLPEALRPASLAH